MDEVRRRAGKVAAHLLNDTHQFVLHNERANLGILDDVADFGANEAKIDGDRHEPRLGRTCVNLGPFHTIIGKDRDAIAFLEAETLKRVRQPAGPLVPEPERHGALEIANANFFRVEASLRSQHLAESQKVLHGNRSSRSNAIGF